MTPSSFTRITIALLALVLAAPAALARDLYVGEAVLADGAVVDSQALLRALDEVLVRLTGQVDPSPVTSLGVGAGDVKNLIQTRHTIRRERLTEDGETIDELRVRVEFDEPAINRLLRDNRVPRWGRERPPILLWIAVDDDDGVGFAEDGWLDAVIAEQARRLGLDILRPLGDALDMAEVTLPDIRGGFLDSSMHAAQRYGAGVVAMLDLRSDDGRDEAIWSARWFWRVGGNDSGLQHSGQYRDMLVRRGMEGLASDMAARYAVRESGTHGGTRRVLVEGVVDEVHFAAVYSYLEGLSVVEDVRIVAARDRSLEFELVVGGEGLEQFLEMGGLLVRERTASGDTLRYRLRR
jgi:uncharacterized protein